MKEKYRSFVFRASKENESDILEWLEMQDNMAGYIKELIRKDI